MATIDPLETIGHSEWLAAVFGGARYLSVNVRDFPKAGFTISFWFRTTQEGTALFFGNSDDGGTIDAVRTSFALRIGSAIELRFANWAEVDARPPASVLDGLDHHLALAFVQPAGSAHATVSLYLDGARLKTLDVSLTNQQGAPIALAGTPLYMATRPPDHSRNNEIRRGDAFPGRLSDVRIWSRVLTDAEISADQWSTVFGGEPDLYLAIPLDEGSVDRASNKATDLSPARRDAVANIIQDDLNYLYFERSLSAFPLGSRTVELWLRCGRDTGGTILVSYAAVSSSDHPNEGGVPWLVTLGDLNTGTPVTDGAWHHIAVVVDAGAQTDTIYVDGLRQNRRPQSAPGQIAGQPFLIGARQATDANDQIFAGLIKDVYLWSSIRSEDQIWDSAGGQRPDADATLVLNVLQSHDDTSDLDEPAPDAFAPKHCLTLTAGQTAVGGTAAPDPGNQIDIDDYTVVLMVRPRQSGGLFSRMGQQADGLHGFAIACTDNGGVQVSEREGPRFRITTYDPAPSGLSLLDGRRHSVALQCLDDRVVVFLDGLPVTVSQRTSADNPVAIDVNSLAAVRIGGADPSVANPDSARHFEGDVFMVAYWNRGLSPEHLHKAAFDLMDGLYTAMLGYWPLNRTLDDQSDMGDDLTMSTAGRFSPAVRTVWAQAASSQYRFHHLEGIAHRQREGGREVNVTHIVDVPAGAAMFYGGLTGRGNQLAPPGGVAVSLTDPGGVSYTTEADTDVLFVKIRDAGIRAFVVKAPIPGKWTVEIKARAGDDFIFQAHVLPAQGAAAATRAALTPLFGSLAPAVQQRERFSVLAVLAVIATTAVVAVIAAMAVAAGIVTSPVAITFMAILGAGQAAAHMLLNTMDRSDRINACNQTAALTLPPAAAGSPVAGSRLQVIDTLKFPQPLAGAERTTLQFDIPAGTIAFSFHVWFDPTKFSSLSGDRALSLTAPNGGTIPENGEPFLYSANFAMKQGGMTAGYCAVSVPRTPLQANNVIGQWTARILNLSGLDPANIQVRVCLRTVPAGSPAPTSYRVPVNFFYVGSRWFKSTYRALLSDAQNFLNSAVFNQANIHLDCAAVQHLRDDPTVITADLHTGPTAALINKYSLTTAINVYIVENMTLPVMDEGATGGFSAILGPQGFASPFTCVFVSVGDSMLTNTLRNTVGVRIAHEMGHSLGLIHQSSCFDNNSLATNPDLAAALSQCTAALLASGPASATKDSIKGNLMYTKFPGQRLNQKQAFTLQHAPILVPLVLK